MSAPNDFWTTFRQSLRLDTAHQLALGVALGIWLGLIPADSILPYLLLVLVVLSPANLFCLALGWLLGAVVSPSLDSLTSAIGTQLLTWEVLQPYWATILNLPLMSWSLLDNNVVMGCLVLGLLATLPNYLISRGLIAAFGPVVRDRIQQWRLFRWLFDAEPPSPQLQEG